MSSQLLFLVYRPLKISGNVTTANRIISYFPTRNCTIKDPYSVTESFWSQYTFECVFAINVRYCEPALRTCPYPYVIIFGGTDLNEQNSECICDPATVRKAIKAVAFNNSMLSKAIELWPFLDKSIVKIAQAVQTNPIAEHSFRIMPGRKKIFLLVAGIRPVKDPAYLIQEFSAWHRINPDYCLVIVGDNRNDSYHEQFKNSILLLSGVKLLDSVSHPNLLALIRDSFALVNSSISEGMSAAILEAMDLGTPVIARDIRGNTEIVTHKHTGLLFRTPQQFLKCAENLIGDDELRRSLCESAKKYIQQFHRPEIEAQSYTGILNGVNQRHKL